MNERISHCGDLMPFLRLIKTAQEQGAVFGLDEIAVITTAFDQVLHVLKLTDPDDPLVVMTAKLMIELVRNGERDPNELRKRALEQYLEQFQR